MQLSFLHLGALLAFAGSFASGQQLEAAGKPSPNDPHSKIDWSKHQFIAPRPGDSRGPCPGMNTLANHGFVNRNGRNLTAPDMIKAGEIAFNVHRDILFTAAKVSILTSEYDDVVDALENIALHGNIEHDASLSRHDFYLGDHVNFDESIFTTLANSNPGFNYYNATSAGVVQKLRLEQSRKDNPKLRNTIKEFLIRTRESAFYLSVMGDPVTGIAPKQFVNIFFREQRLPLKEGWRVPKNQMTLDSDAGLKRIIKKGSEWHTEGDQCPWFTLSPGAPEDPVAAGEIFAGPHVE